MSEESPRLVRGAPRPCSPQVRFYWVETVGVGMVKSYVILDRGYLGLWTHYTGQATMPCRNTPDCAFCQNRMPHRFNAFTAAHDIVRRRPVVLQWTFGASELLDRMLAARGSCRGAQVRLRRRGAHHNAPLVGEVERYHDEGHLAQPFDCVPSLLKLWGVALDYLDPYERLATTFSLGFTPHHLTKDSDHGETHSTEQDYQSNPGR